MSSLRFLRTPGFRCTVKLVLAAIAAFGLLTQSASAVSYYWKGDVDNFWNQQSLVGVSPTNTNWSTSASYNADPLTLPGVADDVYFYATPASLNTELGQNFSVRSLSFLASSVYSCSINDTLGAGANKLTIGTGGITVNAGAGAHLITAPVVLGASQTWYNWSTSALTFTPNSYAGTASWAGVQGAPGIGLTTAGSGEFNFQTANSYSGATTVATGTYRLSGTSGSSLNSASFTVRAGANLIFDSTNVMGGNQTAQNRIADATGITSLGGYITLLGNESAGTTETAGTLTVSSGATYVNVVPGSGQTATLTFGASGGSPIASLAKTAGGTVTFSNNVNGAVALPNVTLTNSILGGWATIGNPNAAIGSCTLDWVTTSGGNAAPLATYQTMSATPATTDNAKYNATGNATVNILSNQAVYSLYMTGGSTPVSGVTPPNANKTYYNGITFNGGTSGTRTSTLTIGSGGILSVQATGVGHYNNKRDTPNMAFIGYLYDESGSANGNITSSAPDLSVFTAADGGLRIASIITGSINLVKSGPGLLDISNGNTQGTNKHNNTYTGKTYINEGVLLIGQETQLGATPGSYLADSIIMNGGELRTYAGTTFSANRGITVGTRGGTFVYTGGGTSQVTQRITGTGGFTYWGNGYYDGNAGAGATIQLNHTATNGGAHDYQGPTNLWISPSWTGAPIEANAGANQEKLFFAQNSQIPSTSAVTANLVNWDGLSVLTNPYNTRRYPVNLNGTTQSFGSLAGNLDFQNHNGVLTLGANNLSTEYSGIISGSGSITKTGAGTQTFSGSNSYSGATNINAGKLVITGAPTATGAGATYTVAGGAALGGSGQINAPVNVSAGGQLAPATNSTTPARLKVNNTLTVTGSSIAGATAFNFLFDNNGYGALNTGNGASDGVDVLGTGNATLAAPTGSNRYLLNVSLTSTMGSVPSGIGTYKLLTVGGSGTLADSSGTWTINGSPKYNYFVLHAGDAIDASLGGGAVPANQLWVQLLPGQPILTWSGAANNQWNTTGTVNWKDDSNVPTSFSSDNNAIFNDVDNVGPTAIAVQAGGLTAHSMQFDNAAKNYAFSGGNITVGTVATGGGTFQMTQAGSVTFDQTVNCLNVATLDAGTLNVGSSPAATASFGALGINVGAAANLNVAANSSLAATTALNVDGHATFNNAAQSLNTLTNTGGATTGVVTLNGTDLSVGAGTYDGVLTGTGSLTLPVGAGTVTLSNGANAYGATNVNGGILSIASSGKAGTGAVTVTGAGAVQNAGNIPGNLIVGGTGANTSSGTIGNLVGAGGNISLTGSGSVTGNLTYTGASTVTFNGTGNIGGTATIDNGGSLVGPGSVGGAVIVGGGTAGTITPHITPTATTALTVNNNLTLNTNALLNYNFGAAGVSDTITLTGAGRSLTVGSSPVNLNLRVLNPFNVSGNYTIVSGFSTYSGSPTNPFTLVNDPANLVPLAAYNITQTVNANDIQLALGIVSVVWTGTAGPAGAANWDIATTANWSRPVTGFYYDTNNVTFDDTGANKTGIVVTAAGVQPNSITFNNSTGNDYSFTGAGGIGGPLAGGLVKNNTGTVTLGNGPGTFTGPTTINAGTLRLDAGNNRLGTATVLSVNGGATAANAGTLDLNGTNQTVSQLTDSGAAASPGVITNTKAAPSASVLSVNGVGTTTFNGVLRDGGAGQTVALALQNNSAALSVIGANPYSGGTAVNAGVLRAATPAVTLGTGPLSVGAGATLQGDPTAGTVNLGALASVANLGTIHAKTGTLDFGSKFLTGPTPGTLQSNALVEAYYRPTDFGGTTWTGGTPPDSGGDPYIQFQNNPNFINQPGSTHSSVLGAAAGAGSQALNFSSAQLLTRSGITTGTEADLGVGWHGYITVGGSSPLPAGQLSLATNSDDGSAIYVDVNQNGVFEVGELVVNNLNGHGGQQRFGTTASLAAGTYAVAIGYYNSAGAGVMEARYAAGSTTDWNTMTTIDPGAPAQSGLFSAGDGFLRVDPGATLIAGGFTSGLVQLTGTSTSAATLALVDAVSPVASTTPSIQVFGASPLANLTLGNNQTVTTGTLVLAAGTTLNVNRGTAGGGTLSVGSLQWGTTGTINLNGVSAIVTGAGSGTAGTLNVASNANLTVNSTGTLPAGTTLNNSGTSTLQNATQTLAGLNGPAAGVLNLTGTALTVAGGGTYYGRVNGTGSLAVNAAAQATTLNLVNNASNYSGGTTVAASGTLRAGMAGTPLGSGGAIAVNPISTLQFDPLAGTVNVATGGSVTNDGTLYVRSGVTDFGVRVIGTNVPTAVAQPFRSVRQGGIIGMDITWCKPADVGAADFNTAANTDPFITFTNANNFSTPAPGPGKATIDQYGLLAASNATNNKSLSYPDFGTANTGFQAASGGYFAATGGNAAAWVGTLNVGTDLPAGWYTFGTNSDDGSSVYVDGVQVVNNFGTHGTQVRTGSINLAAGLHTVKIGWYNGGGGLSAEARWAPGNNVAWANQLVVSPGVFFFQSQVTIDAGAELRAGGISTALLTMNGAAGNPAISTLGASPSAVATASIAGTNPTATMNLGAGAATIANLNVATGGTLTVNGQGAGTSSLTITGAGGAGTGGLTVNAATLKINPAASVAGTVSMSQAAAASTLDATAIGTATVGGLTLNNLATVKFAPESGGTSTPYVQANGNLNIGATGGYATADLGGLTAVTAGSIYKLIGYTGTLGLGGGALADRLRLINLGSTYDAAVVNAGTSVNVVVLSLSSKNWTGTVPNGSGGYDWDNYTANWSPSNYSDYSGDTVFFGNGATGTAVNIPATVTPRSVNFTSTSLSYTVTGNGIGDYYSSYAGAYLPTAVTVNAPGTTVTLNNTGNTYTGGTFVTAGTLALGSATVLPASGAVTVSTAGVLDLKAFSPTVGRLFLEGGTVQSTGGAATLTASEYNMQGGAVNVNLVGAGAVLYQTAGTTTLAGGGNTYTYTGATNVLGGTLSLAAGGVLNGTPSVTIGGGGTAAVFTSAGTLSGARPITVNALGTMNINGGGSAGTGAIAINNQGTVNVNAATGGTGTVAVNNGGSLVVNVAGSGVGAITVNAGGTLTGASAANALSGLTINNSGGVVVAYDGALGTAAPTMNQGSYYRFTAAQSTPPTLTVADGRGLIGSDTTGFVYGAAAGQVNLAANATFESTAGPQPARPGSGPILYKPIYATDPTGVYNLGEDGTTIYKGASFGAWTTPATGAISLAATFNDAGTTGYSLYMNGRNVTIGTGTTLNTTDTVRGAEFDGAAGVLTVASNPAGTATVYTRNGQFDATANTTNTSLTALPNAAGNLAGRTLNVVNSRLDMSGVNAAILDATGTIVYGANSAMHNVTTNLSSGTYRFTPTAIYRWGNAGRLTAGANWVFDPGAIITIDGGGTSSLDAENMSTNVDLILGATTGITAISGTKGLVLGQNRTLSTGWGESNLATFTMPQVQAAAGATQVRLAGATGQTLTINAPLNMTGVNVLVNDPTLKLSLPQTSGNYTRQVGGSGLNGTVVLNGSVTAASLNATAGTARLVAINTGATGSIKSTGGVLQFGADQNLGAVPGSPQADAIVLDGGILQTSTAVSGLTFNPGGACSAIPTATLTGGTTAAKAYVTAGVFTFSNTAGAGYTSAPTVTLSGGGATTQGTAHALFDSGTGTVTGIVMDTAGVGYTSAPTVTLAGGGFTTAATGAVALYTPQALTLTSTGWDFSTPPTVAIAGGGTTATATAAIASPVTGVNRNVTLGAGGGTFRQNAGTSLTVNGTVSGPGSLTEQGPGELILKKAPQYLGNAAVSSGGTLTFDAAGGATNVGAGASLSIAAGGTVNVKATVADPFTDSVVLTQHTAISNAGAFHLIEGSTKVASIAGAGTTTVDGGASLKTASIVQDTLVIGAGGSVTIAESVPFTGAAVAQQAGGAAQAVPEPGTWVLIGTALVGWLVYRRRSR